MLVYVVHVLCFECVFSEHKVDLELLKHMQHHNAESIQ